MLNMIDDLCDAVVFVGKTLHYLMLVVGAVLVMTVMWTVSTVDHVSGKSPSFVEVPGFEHGAVEAPLEYAAPIAVEAEMFVAAVVASPVVVKAARVRKPRTAKVVVDAEVVGVEPTVSKRRSKKAA